MSPDPRPTEGAQVITVVGLQERVAAMMRCGASLDRVENEVIDPCELSSDQKAALWLYAWSFMEGKEQRDRATRYRLNVRPGESPLACCSAQGPITLTSMQIGPTDDDLARGSAIKLALRARAAVVGWDTEQATSGENALGRGDLAARFDALVVDYKMPGLNGMEVARKTREAGFKRPIIICSAYMNPSWRGWRGRSGQRRSARAT
jgi:CheY-like chemotaxis protein